MDERKPYRGRLQGAFQVIVTNKTKENLGYIYIGKHLDHNTKPGQLIHTSMIVKDNCDIPRHVSDGYMIETENSRYRVVPEEQYR